MKSGVEFWRFIPFPAVRFASEGFAKKGFVDGLCGSRPGIKWLQVEWLCRGGAFRLGEEWAVPRYYRAFISVLITAADDDDAEDQAAAYADFVSYLVSPTAAGQVELLTEVRAGSTAPLRVVDESPGFRGQIPLALSTDEPPFSYTGARLPGIGVWGGAPGTGEPTTRNGHHDRRCRGRWPARCCMSSGSRP